MVKMKKDNFLNYFVKIPYPDLDSTTITYIHKNLIDKNLSCLVKNHIVSPRIATILDTIYNFSGKHIKFLKEFTFKQEIKYGVSEYEELLLRFKFDQPPYDPDHIEDKEEK